MGGVRPNAVCGRGAVALCFSTWGAGLASRGAGAVESITTPNASLYSFIFKTIDRLKSQPYRRLSFFAGAENTANDLIWFYLIRYGTWTIFCEINHLS